MKRVTWSFGQGLKLLVDEMWVVLRTPGWVAVFIILALLIVVGSLLAK